MAINRLSASAIRKYIECPKQFRYKYVERYEVPDKPEPEHFAAGSAVHDAIENVLKNNPPLDDEDELLRLLREQEVSFDYEYPNSSEKVQNSLETAAKYIAAYVEDIHSVEEEWWLDFENISFKGYADLVADLVIDGDVVEEVVVDWKTGQEQDGWKERLQAGVYLEMHNEEKGSYPNAFEYAYLNEGTRSTHKRIDDGEVFWNEKENKYWNEIENDVNDIRRSDRMNEWPAKPGQSKCYFCEFSDACSDYVGSEEVTMNEIEIRGI